MGQVICTMFHLRVTGFYTVNKLRLLAAAALFLFVIPKTLLYVGVSLDPHVLPSSKLQPISPAGVPVFLAGFFLSVASIWQLYSLGSGMPWGDVAEDSQSSKLVTEGLYNYTRNPMLLGYGLLIMGAGLYYGSFTTAFILSTTVVALVSLWIKNREEPELVKRFGQDYIMYRDSTPFIVPRMPRKKID
jgi:protein-S-isoprenylcysteine O-methyltransferase Ste14